MALGSPSIGVPAAGKAGFAIVTVTGTLQVGVRDPGLTLGLAQNPRAFPASVEASAGAMKPTTKGGRTTLQYAVWIANRSSKSLSQKLGLVVVGAHSNWAGDPQIYAQSASCHAVSKARYSIYFHFLGRRTPSAQLAAALRLAHC
jgi:hypothetical protein